MRESTNYFRRAQNYGDWMTTEVHKKPDIAILQALKKSHLVYLSNLSNKVFHELLTSQSAPRLRSAQTVVTLELEVVLNALVRSAFF